MECTSRILSSAAEIGREDWDALTHDGNPFVSREFLLALEESGSVGGATGWTPHHLCLFERGRLVAFAPTYLKSHSHGEFVFDWAWAEAYHRHGRRYYPKLLTAIPYSPVAGPRLLVRRDHADPEGLRTRLVGLALEECERLELSGWHCNFVSTADRDCLERTPLVARTDCQFHWFNRGYADFDSFVADLRAKKRKNLRRDRRLALGTGLEMRRKTGAELNAAEREFVYACYQSTFLAHGNFPALTRDFFERLCSDLPQSVLVVLACRAETPVAMSFFLVGGGRLYGRYWGCTEIIPGLHFETAYHQGIEHCIEHGLEVFEPGAQGEHKISRGFVPTATHSFHGLRDPAFHSAIASYLQRESLWMDEYRAELESHGAFRGGESR